MYSYALHIGLQRTDTEANWILAFILSSETVFLRFHLAPPRESPELIKVQFESTKYHERQYENRDKNS